MVFLGFAVVFAAMVALATRRVITVAVSFFVTLLVVYGVLPVLSFGFWGVIILFIVNGGIAWAIEGFYAIDNYSYNYRRQWGPGIITGIGVIAVVFLPLFASGAMFHHGDYRAILGTVEESAFSSDTKTLDPSQVRVVDQRVAWRLGEKRLGEDAALGSVAELGVPNIQQVNNRLYWVIPLNHSGFFKWLQNREGTPGYILVSATNGRDVKLVQKIDGKPIRLRYNAGNFFGDKLSRYLYTHGYMTVGLADYTFEIDDDGRPYWVVTKYQKRVGFMGKDAVAVVLLNAQTGDITEYSIDEAPPWVDRIQPADFVVEQINDWGRYVHGWWAQNPSCKECLQVSPGISLVYGDDGRSYWYSGITSTGADNSTVGFVLVDTRTKRVRFYKHTGATEGAAMGSARGSVQEKGYTASFPILYNVGGMPTYFTTLKDDAGLVKLMAFISVEDYQIVGIGENVQAALRQYRRALVSRGNDIAPDSLVESWKITGTIIRLALDREGNYYLLISGHENKAFVGSTSLSVELPLSREGDRVAVTFDDGGNEVVDMTEFDNLELAFQKTEEQIGVERYAKEVRGDLLEQEKN